MLALVGNLLTGCDKTTFIGDSGSGIPRQVYDEVPIYTGPVNSVGTLTQAYIRNTEGLLMANSRLRTLCIAYGKCKQTQE
jgi:hypothetical protein